MRRPTPRTESERWWREDLAGNSPALTTTPEAGWYKIKKKKGGPWLALVIWLHSPVDEDGFLTGPEELYAKLGGEFLGDPEKWWTSSSLTSISVEEYNFMLNEGPIHDPEKPPIEKISFEDLF
jgi:hypothetical protein